MRKTRGMWNSATLFKATVVGLRSEEERSNAGGFDSLSVWRFAGRTRATCGNVGVTGGRGNVGVAEGHQSVRPAWLARVKRPMNMSSRPWKFTKGRTTEAKQPFQTRHRWKRQRPHERGRKHLYEQRDGHRSRLSRQRLNRLKQAV
jgi:hypothetical protein